MKKFVQLWNDLLKQLKGMNEKLLNFLCEHLSEQFDSELKWLNDVEQMVSNQLPPSLQYGITNQLNEQRFLAKLLADHRKSHTSLPNLANEVTEICTGYKETIDDSMNEIMARLNQLVAAEKDRSK